ncbi:hypothetical protein [Mucilaginibacter sp. UYCu711]|uniref:glycosyl-4,4'-diaponeurosporenoate acyltransferase CrtO family protein n=1 Tax=Mucilaginibacter sp. UYCu711 TaxID=3156339 RepID=UPI003D1CE7A8
MNQAVNFFWTILCFIPVIGFWLTADLFTCYVFIGVSAASLLLPAKLLQLSNQHKFYEKLGIKLIRKFVQNGEYINAFLKKRNPQYKIIRGKLGATGYMKTVIMYERYHFLCFIFFLLTDILAVISGRYSWAVFIFLANIVYNVCPILL